MTVGFGATVGFGVMIGAGVDVMGSAIAGVGVGASMVGVGVGTCFDIGKIVLNDVNKETKSDKKNDRNAFIGD